jgi:hypothetical protein
VSGVTPEARRGPTDPRRLARQLKRLSALLAALAFGAFWSLAAGHPVGVTASQASAAQAATTAPVQVHQAPIAAQSTPSPSSSSSRVRSGISNGGSSAPVLSSGSS